MVAVGIVAAVPGSVPVRIVTMDTVEVVGLSLLCLVVIGAHLVVSLVPSVRVGTIVAVIPGSIPARIVAVSTVEVVGLGLLKFPVTRIRSLVDPILNLY